MNIREELFKLEREVENDKVRKSQKLKQGYALARSLGFDSYQATRLQGKSEQVIRALAQERDKISNELNKGVR